MFTRADQESTCFVQCVMVGNARVEWENSDNHKLQVTHCLATSSQLKGGGKIKNMYMCPARLNTGGRWKTSKKRRGQKKGKRRKTRLKKWKGNKQATEV
jgi:hypothetical protein